MPDELQNWRVLLDSPARAGAEREPEVDPKYDSGYDIDGEAHPVDSEQSAPPAAESGKLHTAPDAPPNDLHGSATRDLDARNIDAPYVDRPDSTGPARDTAIRPQIDSLVLASVGAGPYRVNPGGQIELTVDLVNNGDAVALFQVHVEGWIRSDWVTVHPVHRRLLPGERNSLTVTIAPPHSPLATAGINEIVVVAQAREYPGRQTRLPVSLEITPYDDLLLTDLQPDTFSVSAGRRVARTTVTLFNNGNRPASVRVNGLSPDLRCVFGFGRVARPPVTDGVADLSEPEEFTEELTLEIEPNEAIPVRVAIRPQQVPFFGLNERRSAVRVVAAVLGKTQVPRAASGWLIRRPLFGALHLGIALLLLFLSFFMVMMLGAVGMGITQLIAERGARQPTLPQAQPQVVIVVPVNESVPQAPATGTRPVESGPAAAATPGVSGRDLSVPLVGAGQVTAPGEAVAVPQAPAPAPVASVSVDRTNMTYAQLFQEIGAKYNLDWRMLAAQAYVESRFDTLALGTSGDLGLMQILPDTWREWAPVADVNDPFDAYSNVLVAASYLDYLRSLFAARGLTEDHWILVAYNWGPDKVLSLVDAGNEWMDLDPGMRQYALDVLRTADTIPLE